MITALLVGALAVTWAWEVLLQAMSRLSWNLPSFVLPAVVYGLALIFCWPDWKVAAASAGLAGLVRTALNVTCTPAVVVPARKPRRFDLP